MNHDHLDAKTLPLFELSTAERALSMLDDRFLNHDRLVPILDYIEFLRWLPRQSRASGLVVSGPPGTGKTMLSEAVQRRFPPRPATEGVAASMPVLAVEMTGVREARMLYDRMLAALGVPNASQYTGQDRERMVLKLCRAADVRLLVVDEIQDVLHSTARQQVIAFDTIKFLMNELHLPIVTLGTSRAPEAMKVDEHLNARFTERSLPLWRNDQYLIDFLNAMESLMPLHKPSHLSSLPLATILVRLSEGRLGAIVKMIKYAAAVAVESGEEQITAKGLEQVFFEPPVSVVRAAQSRPRIAA